VTAAPQAALPQATLPQATTPRTESVFRPVFSLMCGRTLAFAATFFIPVVLARVFDPAQFATYKQLFLIYSTVYLITQAGMASSLYYFVPRAPADAGRYAANSLFFLAAAGVAGFGALLIVKPKIAHWMNNPELSRYIFWIGLYLFLMMLSATLEIVLISRRRYVWASASYASFDLARAAASILPVLLFRDLDGLFKGLVMVAFLRAAITVFYFRTEFRDTFRFDKTLLRSQLAYAMPFALAIVVEIVQGSLPQYVVAWISSPATFAIFAVGCLSVPLVDVAASPTSDVMMVQMQENLAAGRLRAVLGIWLQTTGKLALLFFPLAALMVVGAREIIVLLFTAKYVASIPIFMAWSMTILFATLQVDGVLRVFAQTRLLLWLNLMRLAIIAGLIQLSLWKFSLIGPVLVILLATLAFKAGALVRMKRLLDTSAGELLPWRNLAGLLGASAGAAAVALGVKSQLNLPAFPLLVAGCVAFAVVYALLVWYFDLLSTGERRAIADYVSRVLIYRKREAT
jgi:O-antigen/teichoic acid export membrane protein